MYSEGLYQLMVTNVDNLCNELILLLYHLDIVKPGRGKSQRGDGAATWQHCSQCQLVIQRCRGKESLAWSLSELKVSLLLYLMETMHDTLLIFWAFPISVSKTGIFPSLSDIVHLNPFALRR